MGMAGSRVAWLGGWEERGVLDGTNSGGAENDSVYKRFSHFWRKRLHRSESLVLPAFYKRF